MHLVKPGSRSRIDANGWEQNLRWHYLRLWRIMKKQWISIRSFSNEWHKSFNICSKKLIRLRELFLFTLIAFLFGCLKNVCKVYRYVGSLYWCKKCVFFFSGIPTNIDIWSLSLVSMRSQNCLQVTTVVLFEVKRQMYASSPAKNILLKIFKQ